MAGVKTEGARALARELRAIDRAWAKELQKANKRVAGEVVVPAARGLAASRTNPKWGQRALDTIRPLATQTKAYVALGSAKVRWAAGENFGSKHTRVTNGRHSTNQFPMYKGKGDYALLTAIDMKRGAILTEYVTATLDVVNMIPDGVGRD